MAVWISGTGVLNTNNVADGAITQPKLETALRQWKVITDTTLSSSAAAIDITGIASGYKMFKFIIAASTTDAAEVLNYLRFNGDAGANYNATFIKNLTTTVSGNTLSGINQIYLWQIGHSATTFDIGEAIIHNTAGNKSTITGHGTRATGGVFVIGGSWNTTTEINQITLTCSSGNYRAGTRLILLGASI